MKKIDKDEFIKVCKNSLTMAQASVKLDLHFNTFKKYAVKFGCYSPNPSGKGIKKKAPAKVELQQILLGNYPSFQTFKLKNRLLNDGMFDNVCSMCGIKEWNGTKLNMELDHIDGNRTNHRIENLRMLCPNCHAQTETYRSKNRKK